jgi:hypothetical protein
MSSRAALTRRAVLLIPDPSQTGPLRGDTSLAGNQGRSRFIRALEFLSAFEAQTLALTQADGPTTAASRSYDRDVAASFCTDEGTQIANLHASQKHMRGLHYICSIHKYGH